MFIQIRKCFWPLMLLQVRRGCTGNHPDVTKTSGYKTRILKRTRADKAIYAFRDQISFYPKKPAQLQYRIQCLKMPKIRINMECASAGAHQVSGVLAVEESVKNWPSCH